MARLLCSLLVCSLLLGVSAATAAVPQAPFGGPVDDHPDGPPVPDGGYVQTPPSTPLGGTPVWPGVAWDVRSTTVGAGLNVNVHVLHLAADDAGVDVTPVLAGGTVRGTAPVPAQAGDPLVSGRVAGINGGFWLTDPYGEPNGLLAIDGRLVSEAETQGAGPRGAVGFLPDGRVLVDRVESTLAIHLPDGTEVEVDGLNRGHREWDQPFADGVDATLAYTPDFGADTVAVTAPAPPPGPTPPAPVDLATIRLAVPHWPAAGVLPAVVTGLTRDEPGTFTLNPGEVSVRASGVDAAAFDGLVEGDTVHVATTLEPGNPATAAAWNQIRHALAAGPQIIEEGHLTDPADWEDEGFAPAVHSNVRAPRSAVGVTADGRLLLVAVDGRRPGITHGMTIAELAAHLRSLGAMDALSLDGGGSTQLAIDGIVRNEPCCDSSLRAVATSLFVVHDHEFAATDRIAGAGRVDTAAAIARAAFPGGAEEALLAFAGDFPDALAGGPLAGTLGAPLLLTAADGVPGPTREVLRDLGVEHVTLLGGEAVIGPEVAEELRDQGLAVRRAAGPSRVETATAIADRLGARDGRVLLTWAGGFADALVAAGPGGMLRMPILLSGGEGLHPVTARWIRDHDVEEVVVVGGPSRLGDEVVADLEDLDVAVTRLAGPSRFATARQVNDWLLDQIPPTGPVDLSELIVTRGDAFPDALAGGVLAAVRRQQLMLLPGRDVTADPDAAAFLDSRAGTFGRVTLLGGLGGLSSYQQLQLDWRALGG